MNNLAQMSVEQRLKNSVIDYEVYLSLKSKNKRQSSHRVADNQMIMNFLSFIKCLALCQQRVLFVSCDPHNYPVR